MRKRSWTTITAVGFLLTTVWLGSHPTSGQTTPKQKTKIAAIQPKQTPAEKLAQRKALLERNEQRRIAILNQLEFWPRPPLTRPPFPNLLPDRAFPAPAPFPRLCFFPGETAPADIDLHRSLFIHDRATLDAADFSLKKTLKQLAKQVLPVVPGTSAASIFRQFWDTQNAAPGQTPGPHCSDNGGQINGLSIDCPRVEGQEALGTDNDVEARIATYAVLALVNRLDLAHQGWRNCGEHRIIYGKEANGRNLIIFEAVLPNPRPGCREGCIPVAEFWKSLSAIANPAERAAKLEGFFYDGLPGFRPVVHVDHYSATGVSSAYGSSGSGQIRTNQFLQSPWMLKEFKTVIDCGVTPCTFNVVPIMVKNNPDGNLWNEDRPGSAGVDFRADVVAQIPRLTSANMSGIGYEVHLAHDAGQSNSQGGIGFVDHYTDQMNAAVSTTFRVQLATPTSYTADQIANRALTQSCAGCHQPSTFGLHVANSIGPATAPIGSSVSNIDSWPPAVPAGFIHVDVQTTARPEFSEPAVFGAGQGQRISHALSDFFLPERKNLLIGLVNERRCACLNRFQFLDPVRRRRAFEIETRIQKDFDPRLDEIDQALAASGFEPTPSDVAKLVEAKRLVLAARQAALLAALAQGGINPPDAEQLNLTPHTMKLRAGTQTVDRAKVAAARTLEVNQIVQREPPRRTVTGSFRPH